MKDYDKFFQFDQKMAGKIKARDITLDLEIDFMEAVNGVSKAVSYECVFKDQNSEGTGAVIKQRREIAQVPKGVHDGITLRM
jgi:DnaJ-class molecular chaperone